AARLAVTTVRAAVAQLPGIEEVIFCCFAPGDLAVYQGLLAARDG
ncbi:MAG: hypothetical protein RLZ44_1418, partial [Pseudomonadota bacterium]